MGGDDGRVLVRGVAVLMEAMRIALISWERALCDLKKASRLALRRA